MENAQIAQTLEAYAALLELAGPGYYTARAYRRAAELIRETRAPVAELVRAGAMRHPSVRCFSHPKGRIINHRPPNALMLERAIEVARAEGVALETNGLPDRIDLRDEEVRLAVEAGVPIVCSTDAHSVRGLGKMQLAVATARRGWATTADVLNTHGLDEVLGLRRH